jgi:hypothetical protein
MRTQPVLMLWMMVVLLLLDVGISVVAVSVDVDRENAINAIDANIINVSDPATVPLDADADADVDPSAALTPTALPLSVDQTQHVQLSSDDSFNAASSSLMQEAQRYWFWCRIPWKRRTARCRAKSRSGDAENRAETIDEAIQHSERQTEVEAEPEVGNQPLSADDDSALDQQSAIDNQQLQNVADMAESEEPFTSQSVSMMQEAERFWMWCRRPWKRHTWMCRHKRRMTPMTSEAEDPTTAAERDINA